MISQAFSLIQNVSNRFRRSGHRYPRIAVLVDADGVSAKDAERVLAHVSTLGRICIFRTYGNFTGSSASTWAKVLKTYGAVARHMPAVAPKKNASDIALSIDAIEILLTRRIDTFVFIASDSDFAPLIRRIREDGKDILGFGHKSTPASVRKACTSFRAMHTLVRSHQPAAPLWSLEPADAEELVLPMLEELCAGGEPVEMSTLGLHLTKTIPGFDPRTYRRRNLSELLRDMPAVEVLQQGAKRFVRLHPGN